MGRRADDMPDTPALPKEPPSRVPFPDPTDRTREDLLREIKAVRELMESSIGAHASINQEKIKALQDVTAEHNLSVAEKLRFLETQRLEQKQDTRQAVEAALAAAKEAVTITAGNTKEQIASLSESFATTMNAMSDKLEDVKNQVTANVASIQGRQEGKNQMSDSLKLAMAIIGSVVLLIGFFIAQRGGP